MVRRWVTKILSIHIDGTYSASPSTSPFQERLDKKIRGINQDRESYVISH